MPLKSVQRPSSIDHGPVLVLLHGLGSNEQDLFAFAPQLDPQYEVVSFRAPYETGYGGYAWFDIEFLPDGSRKIDADQALASRDEIVEELARFAGRRIILAGFSQGAMMASGVALARPDLVQAGLLMSGRWLPPFERNTPAALPFLVQHGLYDPVLSIGEGRELAAKLKELGHSVEYREYPMAHSVSYESLADAITWLSGQCC